MGVNGINITVIIRALIALIRIIQWLILIRAVISWLPMNAAGPIYVLLSQLTEPVVGPVRSVMERLPSIGEIPIDFSPLVAYFLLGVVSVFLGSLL